MGVNFLKCAKSYRTTIAGISGALIVAYEPFMLAIKTGGAAIDWNRFAIATVIAVLGWLSKDAAKND